MSRKTDLNLSIGVDVKKGFEEAVVDIKNNGNKLAKASKQIAQSIGKDYAASYKKFNTSFKETNLIIKDQEKNLKILTNELRQLEKQAKKYVVVPPKLRSELNHVTRALTDQRKGLKRLTGQALAYKEGMKASQMKVGIQQVGNAVEGVARSFQVAQGAAALLGDENEDVMKAMHKMQAVMVFSEGLRGLKHLKTSFELLNRVVKANPILVAAAAITALGVAAIKISQHFDKAYQAQKRQQEITEKATSSIDKEVTTLDNLVAIAKDETIARETRLKAVKSLNETYPTTLGNLELQKINEEKATKAILKTKDALLAKAKAQVVHDELVESVREERKLEKEQNASGILENAKGIFNFYARGAEHASTALVKAQRNTRKLREELKELTGESGMPDIDLDDDKGPSKTKKLTPFQINTKKLENNLIDAKNKVKRNLLDGIILEKDAKNQLAKLEVDFAIKKVAIAKKYAEEANKAEADSLDKQISYKKSIAEQERKDKEQAFETTLQEIDTQEQKIENRINERLAKGVDTQAQHDKKIFDAKSLHLAGLIGLYESQGMETADLEAELLKTQIDYAKQLTDEKAAQLKQQARDEKAANKESETLAKEKLRQEKNLNNQLNRMLSQSQVDLYSNMAQNMGQAIANNENVGEAMGNTIMSGIADFITNMGQMMITAGVAKLGFDAAMVQFGGAGGAIAAGFGLVLAGSTMKNAMSKDIAKPTALAEGGVMRGTTFGMLAEYNTANNDPEVAIRSSYLRGMIADAVGNNNNGGNVKFRIEGRDLVGVLGRGLKDNGRA
jgi:deoxycytidylate deaminase